MGYRQNNPNFQQAPSGGLFEQLLPMLLAGQSGAPSQPASDPQGGPATRGMMGRDPGYSNNTPYVIGSGPGGSYNDEVYPGEYGAGNLLSLLGRLIGGASNVLPIPYGGLIGGAMQRGGNMMGGGQQLEGPPQSVQTPVPRSVINDGWENLFLGDSEYFWNSIQPNARAGAWRYGGGGHSGGLNTGAFRDSGGWGALAF
jgi:hypothetical protein